MPLAFFAAVRSPSPRKAPRESERAAGNLPRRAKAMYAGRSSSADVAQDRVREQQIFAVTHEAAVARKRATATVRTAAGLVLCQMSRADMGSAQLKAKAQRT
jgi:hypothetical protein